MTSKSYYSGRDYSAQAAQAAQEAQAPQAAQGTQSAQSGKEKLKKVTEEEFVKEPSYVSTLSNAELKDYILATREALAHNLDTVEDRANPAKALERTTKKLKKKIDTMKEEQPIALAAIGVGVAAVVGLAIFGIVRYFRR